MGYTLFLGAGFSKWAANLPTANELFDFNIDPWPKENTKLQLVKKLKQNWDNDNPETYAEKFITAALALPEKQSRAVVWYITRRLSEPFIYENLLFRKKRRHVVMVDNVNLLGDDGRRGISRATQFLSPFLSLLLDGIITTNYDLLIEYTLGSKRFNYGSQYQVLKAYRGRMGLSDHVQLQGRLPLLKLHGSVSWDTTQYYADGRCGLTGNALIVPPTPGKQPHPLLEMQWEIAYKLLQKSQHLAIFGFAFNPYDESVLELIKLGGKNLKSVLLIDVEPQVERVRNLLPNATIIPCLPPPMGHMDIRKWLNEVFLLPTRT